MIAAYRIVFFVRDIRISKRPLITGMLVMIQDILPVQIVQGLLPLPETRFLAPSQPGVGGRRETGFLSPIVFRKWISFCTAHRSADRSLQARYTRRMTPARWPSARTFGAAASRSDGRREWRCPPSRARRQ